MTERASPDLRVEPLRSRHDRTRFSCGVESLDAYFKAQAGQDVRRRTNAVFVLVNTDTPADVLGYFTLCSSAVSKGDLPDAARKYLPRYPLVSAVLIGRLAVATSHQGQGLGAILLADALRKAYEASEIVGSSMVLVDAIDERAAGFYAD